jgi:hypothetical protein
MKEKEPKNADEVDDFVCNLDFQLECDHKASKDESGQQIFPSAELDLANTDGTRRAKHVTELRLSMRHSPFSGFKEERHLGTVTTEQCALEFRRNVREMAGAYRCPGFKSRFCHSPSSPNTFISFQLPLLRTKIGVGT